MARSGMTKKRFITENENFSYYKDVYLEIILYLCPRFI